MVPSAIILAAGMGIRMRALGEQMPKGYICLGTSPILEESISHLVAVGIGHIVIVTGHLAEFFEPLPAKYNGIVRLVHNPLYAESGSMYSLYCARTMWTRTFYCSNPTSFSSAEPSRPA